MLKSRRAASVLEKNARNLVIYLPWAKFISPRCPIGIHPVRHEILSDASCQSCMVEGEVETSRHFHLHCPALARLRSKQLGNLTNGEPEDKAETKQVRKG